MTRHRNIPIFIPHLGCPHDCVFCNQRTISGQRDKIPADVEREIETALATIPSGTETEIAFFGGSFTGIGEEAMIRFLDIAQAYVDGGRVDGIRLSTRPDMIDRSVLALLGRYAVKTVELGLQSLDDRVLAASCRGHTAKQAESACRMVKEAGFSLIGQMMIGLPEATPESEVETAEVICRLGADGARIYPTVVLAGTALSRMAEDGRYRPLPLTESVVRTADAFEVFLSHRVPVLRIGLQAGEGLSPETVTAGVYHPATGDLVKGEIFFRREVEAVAALGDTAGKKLILRIPRGCLSEAVGQKGRNRARLTERFGIGRVRFSEETLPPFTVYAAVT